MAIQEEKVRETLRTLQGQRERLKQELWATEGAIAVCVRLLTEDGEEPGRKPTTGGEEEKGNAV